jgi:hypothetical protein
MDKMSVKKKSTGAVVGNPSTIGGRKEKATMSRIVNTSVRLYERKGETFSQVARRKSGGVRTTGGK